MKLDEKKNELSAIACAVTGFAAYYEAALRQAAKLKTEIIEKSALKSALSFYKLWTFSR